MSYELTYLLYFKSKEIKLGPLKSFENELPRPLQRRWIHMKMKAF